MIEGPAVISFSGGRTSAYMLHCALDRGLQKDVHVLFADTGRERAETYEFVHAVEQEWQIPIHWVHRPGYFEQLITDRRCPPNPIARFCTQELKIRPMQQWMQAHGYEHWTNVVGIRADEPRRVAKMRAAMESRRERWDIHLPLAEAGVMVADVSDFWRAQPFDLQLRPHEGNCDCCFLKSYGKLKNIVRDRPDLAQWWADQEQRTGFVFRQDRPSYARMLAQPDLFTDPNEDLIECYCTE